MSYFKFIALEWWYSVEGGGSERAPKYLQFYPRREINLKRFIFFLILEWFFSKDHSSWSFILCIPLMSDMNSCGLVNTTHAPQRVNTVHPVDSLRCMSTHMWRYMLVSLTHYSKHASCWRLNHKQSQPDKAWGMQQRQSFEFIILAAL